MNSIRNWLITRGNPNEIIDSTGEQLWSLMVACIGSYSQGSVKGDIWLRVIQKGKRIKAFLVARHADHEGEWVENLEVSQVLDCSSIEELRFVLKEVSFEESGWSGKITQTDDLKRLLPELFVLRLGSFKNLLKKIINV